MMAVIVSMNVARRSRLTNACTGKVVGSSKERAVVAENIINQESKCQFRGQHTQAKGKHIWQRPRSIIDNMKLTSLQQGVPDSYVGAESFASISHKVQETESIQEPQHRSNYQGMLVLSIFIAWSDS